MKICVCSNTVRKNYGTKHVQDQEVCEFCEKPVENIGGLSAPIQPADPVFDTIFGKSHTKPISSSSDQRLLNINNIIQRMWWWIGLQGFFLGVWMGSNLGTGSELIYGDYAKFDFGLFLIGCLVGVGAFAPLVFVVEALREVVINLVKGPIPDKFETK